MILRCIRKFGNFSPGDEIEVDGNVVFDSSYFEAVAAEEIVTPSARAGARETAGEGEK